MPMIDIYAKAGTFADTKKLATDAAATVKKVEGVPDIPMFVRILLALFMSYLKVLLLTWMVTVTMYASRF